MRLKIKGEITQEQLAKALDEAVKVLESLQPGAKFYGANLYLTPYDTDGDLLTIVDERHHPLVLEITAQSGTIAKPALTAEAQQRRDAVREAKRQRANQLAERDRQELAEYNRKRQIQAVQITKAQIAFGALNELTSKLLASEPQVLVDRFNDAIRVSWHSHEPKEPHGPRKGELKPLPKFSIVDGKLSLFAASWKNPRLLLNPIGNLNSNLIAPVWTHDAWLVAVDSFLRIMRDMGGTIPEEIFGDHLPKGIAAD
ncbi:OfxX fusion product [Pseudomonas granadensis]|uniref:OfxX fusion product n=1 Tax=Pseudomonas granadensis TaxID=1421430 RepID=UPI00300E9D10